jgi:hyperosmotically inducible protein
MGVMKLRITAALLAALALGTAAGCSTAVRHERIEKNDDATITAGVKAALVKEPDLKGSQIDVETTKGIVQLSGFVGSPDDVATAATAARTVKGVRSIRNELRLR